MHHLVRHHIHHGKYLERNHMYWAMSLKTLGISLVSVFIPAYLYELGYSLRLILLYFLLREIVELLMVVPTSKMIIRFGSKIIFTFGCMMTIVSLLLLYALPGNPNLFALTAITEGLAISLFFLPYHYIFSASVTKTHGGSDVGFMDNLVSLVAAVGPFVGGVIATVFSIRLAMAAAILFVLTALIPLIRSIPLVERSQKEAPRLNLWLPEIRKDLISSVGFGVTEMAATIIWPLYIFLIVTTYLALGGIVSASLLITVGLVIVIGKLTDKGKGRKLMKNGAFASAIVHILRFGNVSYILITVVNILGDIAHAFFRVPWSMKFYRRADGLNRMSYIAVMEFAMCGGRAAFWIILIGLTYIASPNIVLLAAFALGAAGLFLVPNIMPKEK